MWMLKWANSQVGREVDPSRPLRYSLQPSSVLRGSWARSRAGGYLRVLRAPPREELWQLLLQVTQALPEYSQPQACLLGPLPLPCLLQPRTALCLYPSPLGNNLPPKVLGNQCVGEPGLCPKKRRNKTKLSSGAGRSPGWLRHLQGPVWSFLLGSSAKDHFVSFIMLQTTPPPGAVGGTNKHA